jgi:mRNA interferase MazF
MKLIGRGNLVVNILQDNVFLVNLDPTIGSEIKKTRPCVIISPNEMNNNIQTVIIAPMTTKSHNYPTRVALTFAGKKGWIVLDQIRVIDKNRLIKEIGKLSARTIRDIKEIIKEMLVD